ncbi:hypothetical protein RRG08_020216 [Elysia crispata]|uniref:Uncharacterized protein n=1 Tax=Elysia crispata TaxID=231223 RepID=A0AAE1A3B5_9GAST|nr:hypothetical protein RRG08_020216 [Elysia crispata]
MQVLQYANTSMLASKLSPFMNGSNSIAYQDRDATRDGGRPGCQENGRISSTAEVIAQNRSALIKSTRAESEDCWGWETVRTKTGANIARFQSGQVQYNKSWRERPAGQDCGKRRAAPRSILYKSLMMAMLHGAKRLYPVLLGLLKATFYANWRPCLVGNRAADVCMISGSTELAKVCNLRQDGSNKA